MRSRLVVVACILLGAAMVSAVSVQAQAVRSISLARSSAFPATPPPVANPLNGPEFDSALIGNDPDADSLNGDASGPGISINRSIANGPGSPIGNGGSARAKSNPELVLSLDALNHFQQRFVAGGGNQFSIEPPDQGLCVGNGFVLETLNDVLQVFDSNGNPLTPPTALNSFYGYAPAINRGVVPNTFGPEITDPSCIFDSQTQRWFHVVLTLDRASPSGQGAQITWTLP